MSGDPSVRRVSAGERLAVSSLIRGFRYAPGVTRRLRPWLVRRTWTRVPAWRETLRRNGAIILGPEADEARLERYGLGVLENMQRYMEGLVVAATTPVDVLLDRIGRVEGLDEFRHLFENRRGRGIVMLSMHMGEFEPAAALIGRHVRMHVLYQRDPIRALETVRARARRRLGVTEHAVDGGLSTWADLRDALARGEAAALLADRVQPGQTGTEVEVFGRPMEIPVGPFKLAASAGAALVPVFNWREPDGTLALRMCPPLDLADGDLRRDPAGHGAVRTWVALMEEVIAARPSQWLNVHPVWDRDVADRSAA